MGTAWVRHGLQTCDMCEWTVFPWCPHPRGLVWAACAACPKGRVLQVDMVSTKAEGFGVLGSSCSCLCGVWPLERCSWSLK